MKKNSLTIRSKPGAAAMATWLSNQCIGLHPQGYGALLSEACFSSSRVCPPPPDAKKCTVTENCIRCLLFGQP